MMLRKRSITVQLNAQDERLFRLGYWYERFYGKLRVIGPSG
jgi:hypothetical protein